MKKSSVHCRPLTIYTDLPALAQDGGGEEIEDAIECVRTGSSFSAKLCFITELFDEILDFNASRAFIKS